MNFIFGGDTGQTYEQVQRRRQIADQLMAQGGTPRTTGEGIASFAKQISGALIGRKADKRDDALRSEADKLWENSMGSLFGGGGASMSTRSAPAGAPVTPVTTAPLPTEGDLLGNDAMAAIGRTPNNPTAQPTTSVSTRGAQPSFLELARQNIFPGESGGDYNALFGYSNRDGGKFDGVQLTNMTVDQALDFSKPSGEYGQHVRGQVGRVATPMGAYQVVGTTLRAAKDGLGLTGNETMTPELQDRIGEWIYQNQGPAAWEAWGKGGGAGGGGSAPQGGGRPNVSTQQIVELLSNPYIRQDPAKAMVLQSLLQQNLAGPEKPDLTTGQREYEFARSQGFQGSFLDYQTALAEARRTSITNNVGGGGPQPELLGTQGLVAIPDDTVDGGYRVQPAPGSPLAQEQEEAAAQEVAAAESAAAGSVNVLEKVQDVAGEVESNPFASGLLGRIASSIPGTGAYDIERTAGTIKANLGFDRLTQMRAESPTGGALGSVSQMELDRLESTIANLDLGQSKEQILENLADIERQYTRILRNAYKTGDPAVLDGIFGGRPSFMSEEPTSEATAAGSAPEGVPQELWDVLTPEEKAAWAN